MGRYRTHQERVYDGKDVYYTGPSVSIREWSQGHNPLDPRTPRPLRTTQAPAPQRPQIEYYPCPDVGKLVTMVQRGQTLPPLPPPARPRVNHLACKHCGQVSCRCGVPKQPGLDAVVTLQRQQGKRL